MAITERNKSEHERLNREMLLKLSTLKKDLPEEKIHEIMQDVYKNNVFPMQKLES